MNLYVLRLTPPTALVRLLFSHDLNIVSRLPRSKDRDSPLVLCGLNTTADIKILPRVTRLCPNAWVVAVCPNRWLTDSKIVSLLLERGSQNAISTHSQWVSQFWFLFRSGLGHQKSIFERARLSGEVKSLTRKLSDLSDRSFQLLAQLEHNLELAENIQRNLLPKFTPEIPGVSLCVKYMPAAGVGGDYYDIFELGDKRRFGFLLADSQTHGMAAVLLSILLKVRLEEMKARFRESKVFVDYLARELIQTYRKELARLNLLYGILDRTSLTFDYTVAGNLALFLLRNGKAEPLEPSHNPPLGGVDHFDYQANRLTLKPGDLLLLHTDGLENILPSRKAVTTIIEKQAARAGALSPLSIQNELLGLVRAEEKKARGTDDITLVQIQVLESTLYLASHSK